MSRAYARFRAEGKSINFLSCSREIYETGAFVRMLKVFMAISSDYSHVRNDRFDFAAVQAQERAKATSSPFVAVISQPVL